jgi:hypothetical protein
MLLKRPCVHVLADSLNWSPIVNCPNQLPASEDTSLHLQPSWALSLQMRPKQEVPRWALPNYFFLFALLGLDLSFALARQALYYLISPALISVSQVARIIGVSHRCPVSFLNSWSIVIDGFISLSLHSSNGSTTIMPSWFACLNYLASTFL